jgi:mRNA-degrading endonuclease toxin of MazEF toxin-antitoxin module
VKRREVWWSDLGPYRSQEQTRRRPVIVLQSDTLTGLLQSVLVVALTTSLDRAQLAGTALIAASAHCSFGTVWQVRVTRGRDALIVERHASSPVVMRCNVPPKHSPRIATSGGVSRFTWAESRPEIPGC